MDPENIQTGRIETSSEPIKMRILNLKTKTGKRRILMKFYKKN